MKRKQPLRDGWVCPNCGQTSDRHGRGGARGCKHEPQGPTCPGLVCKCKDGTCFSKEYGYGWRRSPCLNAFCHHCGWKGTIQSREFEREYGGSRCPKSVDGWHNIQHIRFGRNKKDRKKDRSKGRSDVCRIIFECEICGASGPLNIDPIHDIPWQIPERKAPQEGPDAVSPEGVAFAVEDASRGVLK